MIETKTNKKRKTNGTVKKQKERISRPITAEPKKKKKNVRSHSNSKIQKEEEEEEINDIAHRR